MSLKVEGSSCVRCKAYLFSEDDIVYCPECGAPHHRECYNALGHCALEELHGTELEYSREKAAEAQEKAQEKANQQQAEAEKQIEYTKCSMCGEKYQNSLSHCPKCMAPNVSKIAGLNGFDFLGGVPHDYKLDEDVTADEAKQFVGSNTHRYIPIFANLMGKKKVSWNWLAFIFPSGWFLSRKMFKNGIIVGILSLTAALLTIPMTIELNSISIGEGANSFDIMMRYMEAMGQINTSTLLLQSIGTALTLIINTFCALFGDYIYKNHTISAIKKIKKHSDDVTFEYRRQGGVNLLWFFIALMVIQNLPSVLITFIR